MSINTTILESNIVTHSDFRLGGRGICIDFRYMASLDKWAISIPRAHFEINYVEPKLYGSNLVLTMDGLGVGSLDLNDFDKLSRLVE